MCKIKTNPGSTQVEPTSGGGLSPVYTAQTNPGQTRVRLELKLIQVVFYTALFQTNPGRTRVSSVYTTN